MREKNLTQFGTINSILRKYFLNKVLRAFDGHFKFVTSLNNDQKPELSKWKFLIKPTRRHRIKTPLIILINGAVEETLTNTYKK